jgi:hypothetical protein
MSIRSIARSAVALLAILTLSDLAAADAGGSARAQAPAQLQGSWDVRLTPVNCTTGVPSPQFAFNSYLTFGAGGTLVEATSNLNFLAGQRGPGHGYWDRTAPGGYTVVFQAFVHFDGNGRLRGTQRVETELDLSDEDHWDGTALIEFFDTAGARYFSGCAIAAAMRIS